MCDGFLIARQSGLAALAGLFTLVGMACGEVVDSALPDGSPAPEDVDGDGNVASPAADAASACPEGFTGEECDECTIFVSDASGDNSNAGLSWNDALKTVNRGISRAAIRIDNEDLEHCSVWVREGVYVPGSARTDSFELQPHVHIFGGFAGFESSRNERDWEEYRTILSGELATDGDNAYQVVMGADEAVLDGFTVTDGVADGGENQGGGIVNDSVSPEVRNTHFYNNLASRGGAAHNLGDSRPVFVNVMFSHNAAENRGGAIYNEDKSRPELRNVIVLENDSGQFGGGVYSVGDSKPLLTNVAFKDNTADTSGGGLYNGASSETTVINAVFSGNEAGSGAGVENTVTSRPVFVNATFSQNVAAGNGGAMRNSFSADVEIINGILWGNTADGDNEIHDDGSSLLISHTIVQGGPPDTADTTEPVLASNPHFVGAPPVGVMNGIDADERVGIAPAFLDDLSDDLHLLESSPAIDVGDTSVTQMDGFPDVDLVGNPRVVVGDSDGDEPEIDMGAFEFQP